MRWAARAHTRTGYPAMISGSLGTNDIFDHAVANSLSRMPIRLTIDHWKLRMAARDGRLAVEVIE